MSCDCPLASRREFLRELGMAAAALVALGVPAADALAMPVARVRGESRGARPQEKSYPIPAADGVSIDKDQSVILARVQGSVYAFSLACPHQNTALRWDAGEHEFRCPKHHSVFRPDGTLVEGRATRSMDRFALRRQGNDVVVDFDKMYQQDTDGAAWAAAVVRP